MKIKINFISNSSSASFIINWTPPLKEDLYKYWNKKPRGKYATIKEAVEEIFEFYDIPYKTLNQQQKKETVEHIVRNTKKKNQICQNNIFESCFWTVMYNNTQDFGFDVQHLLTELIARGLFISAYVKEDQ